MTLALLIAAPSPGWAVTPEEIRKAQAERAQLQTRLDDLVGQMESAEAKLATTQEDLARLQKSLAESEKRLAVVQGSLSRRANIVYRQGYAGLVDALFSSTGLSDFLRRIAMIERAAGADSASLIAAARLRAEVIDQRQAVASRKSAEDALVKRLDALIADLNGRFRAATRLEEKLRADRELELRRQREASQRAARAAEVARRTASQTRVSVSGEFRCPVDGPNSFRDTWGAPRSGGRRHQGVDIYAAYGTPTAAVVDGTILRMGSSSLGGISIWLKGGDGTEYFYTHLSRHGPVSVGQRVSAGTHIAYVGNSGNAEGGTPHLHFEIHPGGGAAVNPYPTVRAACG